MSNFRNDFKAVEIGSHLWYVVEDRSYAEEGWCASKVLLRVNNWFEYTLEAATV